MVTLGILVLLLLLSTNWIVQVRTVAVRAGESGSSQPSAYQARCGIVRGNYVERLLAPAPFGLVAETASQPLPAPVQDSTLWNHKPTQPLRGFDLCRCARDYKERLSPCLFLRML